MQVQPIRGLVLGSSRQVNNQHRIALHFHVAQFESVIQCGFRE